MKFGVADYGMNVWYGGCYDTMQRLIDLKNIGYDGIERLEAASPSDAVSKAVEFKRLGMDFTTVRGPSIENTIKWTAAFGKEYIWTQVLGKDFDTFCRQVNEQVKAAAALGVRVAIHNHLGTLVETEEELEKFLSRCPECGMVFDTGHHAAAGGDPLTFVKKYYPRIIALHVKDWFKTGDVSPIHNPKWYDCGYFTGLGKGNIGQDNAAVVKAAIERGYDGWVFVEHDTHKQEALLDLEASREYLKQVER